MFKKFNLKTYLEKSNAKFDAATPAQKMVMIAEDVILRMEHNLLELTTGNFLRRLPLQGAQTNSFKEYCNENSCTVCAKGGLFVAYIGRVNKISISEILDENSLNSFNSFNSVFGRSLLELTTKEQIDLIEIAFEGASYLHVIEAFTYECVKAEQYREIYPEPEARMIAICRNIIDNDGLFIP